MASMDHDNEHPVAAYGYASKDSSGHLSRRSAYQPPPPPPYPHLRQQQPRRDHVYGGYSNFMVCDEHFIISIPDNLPFNGAAPLLCAGISVYSPLKYYGLDKPGMHVGVVGLGGLGHMAVKFAKAMGLRVTVISTSPSKKAEAMERLGADDFLVSGDTKQMQGAMGTMDGIIDRVSATHSIVPLLALDKTNGKVVLVGLPEKLLELPAFPVIMGRKLVGGSCIGGNKETRRR
ncbi:hypothetical protein MLD38_028503 [Melastoma candidum]|uniref:Uncharacterized protein n=1 Tax=Melastoma candidum TaxID=119954 RepID=A0ACB9N1S1_9MYRT|nr:hypothetical protein MLD38_028503 [Melastoma candidum]